MIYIKWFSFLIINLLTNYLINFPFAPFVVLFADKDGWLPYWLGWFQTPDNSLDGDTGWRTQNMPYRPENNKYQRWVNRFHWLWRNKLYGFGAACLSVRRPFYCKVVESGDSLTSDQPNGRSGCYKIKWIDNEIRAGKRKNNCVAFQIYYVRQYKHWPGQCIRIIIGWKLWDRPYNASFGASFSPWKTFKTNG